jgi:hypothetical protein
LFAMRASLHAQVERETSCSFKDLQRSAIYLFLTTLRPRPAAISGREPVTRAQQFDAGR